MKTKLLYIALICSLAFNLAFLTKHPVFHKITKKEKPRFNDNISKEKQSEISQARTLYKKKRQKFMIALGNDKVSEDDLRVSADSLLISHDKLEKLLIDNMLEIRRKLGPEKLRNRTKHLRNIGKQRKHGRKQRRRP